MSSSRLITSPTGEALLIVDMISHFEFEDGNKLFANTRRILEPLADLRSQLKSAGVPVIYVNDGIGEGGERRAHDLAELKVRSKKARLVLECLGPEPDDHWLVKPQRSGFYATGLSNLLHHLSVGSVIVAGVTTDICVFFTAHDAYMRGYSIRTPSNCCAAVEESHHEQALAFLARVADADTAAVEPHTISGSGKSASPCENDQPDFSIEGFLSPLAS